MKAQNLHVFLLSGIYLSLVPEMLTLPYAGKNQPRKDYRYFMNLLGKAPARIALFKQTDIIERTTPKTEHKVATTIEVNNTTANKETSNEETSKDKTSNNKTSTEKISAQILSTTTTEKPETKKTIDLSRFFHEARKKIVTTAKPTKATTVVNTTVDNSMSTEGQKKLIAAQFLNEGAKKKKTTKATDTTVAGDKEKTTINPKQVDQNSKWLYNPWIVTLGNQLYAKKDHHKTTSSYRVRVAVNPKKLYNPEKKLVTVCLGTTIPYGDQKVVGWIDRHVFKKAHKRRTFYMDLRRDMYAMSRSELCHSKDMTNWMDYQECSMRRNQRLEAFVPHYPMN